MVRICIICLAAMLSFAKCQEATDIERSCMEGWENYGFSCFKFLGVPGQKQTFPSAQRVCAGMGSSLARVNDCHTRKYIGNMIANKSENFVWIGMNRVNANKSDPTEVMWAGDDDAASIYEGLWDIMQPDLDDGKECVCLEKKADGQYLDAFVKCITKLSYVCERPACPKGSFHCNNGKCINSKNECDGEDDCGDNSDEIKCSDKCNTLLTSATGIVESGNYPNAYPTSKVCMWTIVGPEGSNIFLKFTDFQTEKNTDIVDIMVGGKTEASATFHKRLSGSIEPPASFRSPNNAMIIRFMSDATVALRGFKAEYKSLSNPLGDSTALMATNTSTTLTPPLLDGESGISARLGYVDTVWVITAKERRKIVTVQRMNIDLQPMDRIEIYDGDSPDNKILAMYTSANNDGAPLKEDSMMPPEGPEYVFSTDHQMYIILRTYSSVSSRAFVFKYWQGCEVTHKSNFGRVFSPGYIYGVPYANYQNCKWTIEPINNEGFTLFFDGQIGVINGDELKVFKGVPSNWTDLNFVAKAPVTPIAVSSGNLFIDFKTNAVLNGIGFNGIYSTDCPDPKFNVHTVIDGPKTWRYRDELNITCKEGYTFSSEQFKRFVIMKCLLGGKWSSIIPQCQAVYCGMPIQVKNAYRASATGVSFGDVATYSCYPGFTMAGSANVTCQSNKQWTSLPSCGVAKCPALSGILKLGSIDGSGEEYGSIIKYSCDKGYELVGEPIIICQTNSQWSSSEPSCKKHSCPKQEIENAAEVIPSMELGQTKTVSCKTGFKFSDGFQSKQYECNENETFTATGSDLGKCVNIDECATGGGNTCSQNCHDNDGSYTCSCKEGFTLNNDQRTCSDIKECAVGNGGCEMKCNELDGAYSCSCNVGYELYTTNGQGGFNVAFNENGLTEGDVYRFNHSCIPIECPKPTEVSNGKVMSLRTRHYLGDQIEYFCHLGYQMVNSASFMCSSDKTWIDSARSTKLPVCNVAVCPAADLTGIPVNQLPILSTTGTLQYGEELNITCNKFVPTPYTLKRKCMFDLTDDTYKLMGAPYACQIVDCGSPPAVSGSQAPVNQATTFGAEYDFLCTTLHTRSGNSSAGDQKVRCRSDGKWDLGHLQCTGSMCQDPGTPADADQVITRKYAQGDTVTYKCNKDGYALDNTYAKECVLNANKNGLEWNSTGLPTCIDVQPPSVLNCVKIQNVDMFTGFTLIEPQFTDNTDINSISVTPPHANSTLILITEETKVVTYTTSDFAGLTSTCQITLKVNDKEDPVVTCPSNDVVEYLQKAADSRTITTSTIPSIFRTDNIGVTAFQTNPPTLSITGSNLGSFIVTAVINDAASNTDSCRFEVNVQAHPCSELSLTTPLNGQKTCSETSDSVSCTLTCDQGYTFYDVPGQTEVIRTCSKNSFNGWGDDRISACVQKTTRAVYVNEFNIVYSGISTSSGCIDNYKQTIQNSLNAQVTNTLRVPCTAAIASSMKIEIPSEKLTYNINGNVLSVNLTVEYRDADISAFESCGRIHDVLFDNLDVKRDQALSVLNVAGCNTVNGASDGKRLNTGFICSSLQKQARVDNIEYCFSCPPGTYRTTNNQCKLCAKGTFSSAYGSSACSQCQKSTTRYEGSTSSADCNVGECTGTFMSSDGFHPCKECPRDTYRLNHTHCEPCPDNKKTVGSGKVDVAACQAMCPKGFFSPTGYAPTCKPCPKNYFQIKEGQKMCRECLSNTFTSGTGSTSNTDCQTLTCPADYCKNGGTCQNPARNHELTCICRAGFYGHTCETRVNGCISSPCYNGGLCQTDDTKTERYNCTCIGGFSGDRCDIDGKNDCNPNPCLNGGVCRNTVTGYQCICSSSFSGQTCAAAASPCPTPDDCGDHGTCVAFGSVRRRCDCDAGFTGDKCQTNINDCASNPCQNGGRCVDGTNGATCICERPGYRGNRCEIRIGQCDNTECGGGTCVDDYTKDTYKCLCSNAGSAYGVLCQFSVKVGYQITGVTTLRSSKLSRSECFKSCEDLRPSCVGIMYKTDGSCTLYSSSAWSSGNQTVNTDSDLFSMQCAQPEDDFWSPWLLGTGAPRDRTVRETRQNLKDKFALEVCNGTTPINAECRIKGSQRSSSESNDVFDQPCGVDGVVCIGSPQNPCDFIEVRYKCAAHRVFERTGCITKQDYCQPNPCKNGVSCRSITNGFQCSCSSGLTGSLCQHNIDDCKPNPCLNNAKECIDKLNDFECKCADGFRGRICGENINDCSSNPCNSQGTSSSGCEDLINDYRCPCISGFTDKNCSTNINECESNPCLHGGNCTDDIGDFVCNCPTGWEGKRCEKIRDNCNPNQCQKQADCKNLFGNYFCDCPTGSYGKNCENAPDLCKDTNPCILNRGECYLNNTEAQCKCLPRNSNIPNFKGDGCEMIIDYCADTDLCKNGGKCMNLSPGFKCECPSGYEGTYCETNTNDCFGKTCLGTGTTCIDMVNKYYCRCALQRVGEACNKALNLDYDFDFYLPSKTGYAALPYPIQLNSSGFSVTVWVKFYTKGDTGTFLTIFKSESAHSLAHVDKVLELTSEGVNVYGDDNKMIKQLTHDLPINDGAWHYVTILWHKDKGLKLVRDSLSPGPYVPVWMGSNLHYNLWIALGAKFNDDAEPVEGQGIRGHISQVNIYGREISFSQENQQIFVDPKKTFYGLILAWHEYILDKGVKYSYPSYAKRGGCPTGGSGTSVCPQVKDKEPPTVQYCPSNQHIYNNDKYPVVTWTEPKFSDGNIKRTYRGGELFAWGKYHVTYEARDVEGNAAYCNFILYVQYDKCSTPELPYNGTQVCSKDDNYHGCMIGCKHGGHLIDRVTSKIFTCGPCGDWHPDNRYQSLRYPSCGVTVAEARKELSVVLIYPKITTVNCEGIKESTDKWFREKLITIDNNNGNSICQKPSCTDVYTKTDCVSSQGPTVTKITMNIPSAAAKWNQLLIEDIITEQVLDKNTFDLSIRVPSGFIDFNGFVMNSKFVCPYLQVVIGEKCVHCGPGNYFNNATKTCDDCPIGQYQDQYATDKCIQCSGSKTTEMTGSSDPSMCKDSCVAGQKYDMASNQCKTCGIGFYQSKAGQFHCVPCPIGKTTREEGSKQESDCKDNCASGTELSSSGDGSCVKCKVGTYRTQGVETVCKDCPSENTTQSEGSRKIEDCNIRACDVGNFLKNPSTCEKCPIGKYQDLKLQTSCKPCGAEIERWRTDQLGSTDKSQCKYFCESGYQKVANANSCVKCPVGTYRNNTVDGYYEACKKCPDNKRTPNEGATMVSQCTIFMCGPGTVPNAANTDCLKCKQGFYQPKANQTDCIKCETGRSTRGEGAKVKSECEVYCNSGEDKKSSASSCVNCPIGYYKDNTIDVFMNCTKCDDNYVTNTTKSLSKAFCNVRDCQIGSRRNADDTGCIGCPRGYYQDTPYQQECKKCTGETSTRTVNSTSITKCEKYCPSGQEKDDKEVCQDCVIGYYKDNKEDVFNMCTMCDINQITASTKSESKAACTVANCTAGYKRDTSTEKCVPCPKGYYQEKKWQTNCTQCPQFYDTESTASTSSAHCLLKCDPGKEYDDASKQCTNCARGYYKEENKATKCKKCPDDKTTAGEGTTKESDCSVPACKPGEKLVGSACQKCGYDEYQPDKWQDKCLPCGTGKATLMTGASSEEQCVLDCASGSEYQAAGKQCSLCPRGYYRDKTDRSQVSCQKCPEDKITVGMGGTSLSACNMPNCTEPGTFIDGAKCSDCPRGKWSNDKWRTACFSCVSGTTTQFTKSTSQDDCKKDCDSGSQLSGTICVLCPKGSYRDKTTSWTCENCSNGRTTPSNGATSASQCTDSPCIVGQKFNTALSNCEACPEGTYQDQPGSFDCKQCPNNGFTTSTGSTRVSQCSSYCSGGRHDCSVNAVCSDDPVTNFKCACRENYQGDGKNCTHNCDLGYCLRGTCQKTPFVCLCPQYYSGARCQLKQDASSTERQVDTIVIASVTAGAVLMIIIAVIVACACRHANAPPGKYGPEPGAEFYNPAFDKQSLHSYNPRNSYTHDLAGVEYADDPAVFQA